MNESFGILGGGRIGRAVALLATGAGYDVIIGNSRGPETLADLVAEIGPRARAASAADVARASDVVVIAVPLGAYADLPADALADTLVIDAMNFYPERDTALEISSGVTSSELVQAHLSRSSVVKGFNNIDFCRLELRSRPSGDPDRSALPIFGKPTVTSRVSRLLDDLGYDSVVGGDLAQSWRAEPGTPVYVQPYLGAPPAGLDVAARVEWFQSSPGHVVDADMVRELLAAADGGQGAASVFRPGFLTAS